MSEAVLPMRLRQFRFGAERSRSGAKIGLAGWAFMAATSVAAVALVLGPLSMLLIVAFRGPQDLLPFEQGAQWTLANLAAIYLDANLYRSIIPDTFIFTAGSVTLTFAIAFVLAWLVERTDLPLRDGIYTIVLFPLLVPGIVFSITWIFLLAPTPAGSTWRCVPCSGAVAKVRSTYSAWAA